MRNVFRIGGSELEVTRLQMAGGEVFVLETRSRSSLDYNSVVLNLTPEEFREILKFLGECAEGTQIPQEQKKVPRSPKMPQDIPGKF